MSEDKNSFLRNIDSSNIDDFICDTFERAYMCFVCDGLVNDPVRCDDCSTALFCSKCVHEDFIENCPKCSEFFTPSMLDTVTLQKLHKMKFGCKHCGKQVKYDQYHKHVLVCEVPKTRIEFSNPHLLEGVL